MYAYIDDQQLSILAGKILQFHQLFICVYYEHQMLKVPNLKLLLFFAIDAA